MRRIAARVGGAIRGPVLRSATGVRDCLGAGWYRNGLASVDHDRRDMAARVDRRSADSKRKSVNVGWSCSDFVYLGGHPPSVLETVRGFVVVAPPLRQFLWPLKASF